MNPLYCLLCIVNLANKMYLLLPAQQKSLQVPIFLIFVITSENPHKILMPVQASQVLFTFFCLMNLSYLSPYICFYLSFNFNSRYVTQLCLHCSWIAFSVTLQNYFVQKSLLFLYSSFLWGTFTPHLLVDLIPCLTSLQFPSLY